MFCRIACCLVAVWLVSASVENCPELPSVKYSMLVAKEVEGKIQGTYFCMKGYHLVGKKTLACNASKQWNASVPKCHVGHCPDPVLANGEFNSSGPVNVSDTVTFKCNDDYILRGSGWSQCLENHTWAPPLPICKSRDCGPPGKLAHGYFKGENFTSGSNITYFCEKRYRLVGTQEQQCIDGEWSSVLPVCEKIPEAPQIGFEKALFAFQESEDLCSATENFMKTLKDNGLTMEELKYSLEIKKVELETKMS
ncbi:C4b-binding protein beta chain [Ctenodactylus gundi]